MNDDERYQWDLIEEAGDNIALTPALLGGSVRSLDGYLQARILKCPNRTNKGIYMYKGQSSLRRRFTIKLTKLPTSTLRMLSDFLENTAIWYIDTPERTVKIAVHAELERRTLNRTGI